jgi:excisionase family DNA binding protein
VHLKPTLHQSVTCVTSLNLEISTDSGENVAEMALNMNAPGSRAPWMTAEQGAAYLGIDSRTLLAWARRGKVKGYKLSGTQRHVWRFLIEDLDASIIGAPAVLASNGAI